MISLSAVNSLSQFVTSLSFIENEPFFTSPIFSVGLFIAGFLIVIVLLNRFSNITFGTADSFSSYGDQLKKMRLLSVLAFTLIPIVAYYESEALELYDANWPLVFLIMLAALINFLFSFYKGLTVYLINMASGFLIITVVSLIYLIAFQRNVNTTLVAEASMILLFSKVIFQKHQHTFYFFVYIYLFLALLIAFFSPEIEQLSTLFSTTILGTLVTISLILVEGASVHTQLFANKVLNNSDLFVVVADTGGRIVYVSDHLLKSTEMIEKELIGSNWWKLTKGSDLKEQELHSKIAAIHSANQSIKNIYQLNTHKGLIDVEWSDLAIEENFIMSVGKDITDQNKYQKEIEMLSLVATSVTNGVVILDKENRVLWNNQQLCGLLQVSNSEIKKKALFKLVTATNAKDEKPILSIDDLKENASQTLIVKKNDEQNNYFMVTKSVVNFEDEVDQKRILVWTNITDQWQIEKRYKNIIDNAFDNIYTTNYKGEFTYVNKQMEIMMGLSSDELLKLDYTELMHPDDKVKTIDFYQTQFRNKEPYSYYEFRVKNTNKDTLWVGQNVRLIFDNSTEKKVQELHVVARNITESKNNKEQLKRLSYVARKTWNIVIILDKNFCIEWINDAFTKAFGYDLEEVVGKVPGEVLNGKNTNQQTLDTILKKLNNKQHVNAEIINYDKYGNEKWIELSMDPILDQHQNVINYIAVESDITKRKSQELTIQSQHKSILDSLRYSSLIQKATLPKKEELETINKELFVYFKPKDIIGGDFYIVDTITNNKGNIIQVYIVADCTGHGVPGAILSVLCTSILKESMRSSEVHNPGELLSFTRDRVLEILGSKKGQMINDGMDVGVCVVDLSTGFLDFAGANRPLVMLQKDGLKMFNSDKQSVGFNHSMKEFTYQRIAFEPGDTFYLFSDGIVDQFGGPRSRKFMTKRFKQLLIDIKDYPMNEQSILIKNRIDKWKGKEEQTDDICLLGVKL